MADILAAVISLTGVDGLLYLLALILVGVWFEVWWRIED